MQQSFADGRIARVVAVVIALGMVGLMWQLGQTEEFRKTAPGSAGGPADSGGDDSAFESCRTERLTQIDKMIADGVVGADQANGFKDRAVAMCRGMFPPEQPGGSRGGVNELPPGMRP